MKTNWSSILGELLFCLMIFSYLFDCFMIFMKYFIDCFMIFIGFHQSTKFHEIFTTNIK